MAMPKERCQMMTWQANGPEVRVGAQCAVQPVLSWELQPFAAQAAHK